MSFGTIGDAVGYRLYHQVGRARSHLQESRSVTVDVLEGDDSFLVVFNAPDVDPESVEVRFMEDTVYVDLERFREYREGYRMRFPGRGMTLSGKATLPARAVVDPEAAVARVTERGTIAVELPRGETTAPTDQPEAAAED